jgi:hypothetical protein
MLNTTRKYAISLCSIAFIAIASFAGTFAYPFIGKWVPSQPSVTLDQYDYQDIQNLRPHGKYLQGVKGHTTLTTNPVNNTRIAGMYQYKRTYPDAESHLMVVLDNSGGGDGSQYGVTHNMTAVPGAGDFEGGSLRNTTFSPVNTTARASFAMVPQDTLFYSNGVESAMWHGLRLSGTTYTGGTFPISVYMGSGYIETSPTTIMEVTDLVKRSGDGKTATLNTGSMTHMYVGSPYKLDGIVFDVSTPNGTASTMTVKRYDGGSSAWTTPSISDLTASGGVSLAQDSAVVFADDDDDETYVFQGLALYWYQVTISAGSAVLDRVTCLQREAKPITNIWDGEEVVASSFVWYDQSGTLYLDDGYSTYMQDDDPTTKVDIDSMTTSDAMYIGFAVPVRAINIRVVDNKGNSTGSTNGTVQYRSVAGWTNVVGQTGILSASTALAKTGWTQWNPNPVENAESLYDLGQGAKSGVPLYWYKFAFGATIDAETEIYYITGIPRVEPVANYAVVASFANRAWLLNEIGGEQDKAIYSAVNAPYVWNGSDTGYLKFGSGGKITAANTIFNVFQSTGYQQLIVTKEHETYRVVGSGPEDWVVYQMSSTIGCVAPRSMAVCDVHYSEGSPPRHVLVWQSANGIVMCDGAKIEYISDDIKAYWDVNDALYVSEANQTDSTGWYDTDLRAYKIILGGTELEYSLVSKSWTKLYREDGDGADPLVSACIVSDANGGQYTYGIDGDGHLHRLEYGNDWAGTDITEYIHTKDMMLDGESPFFKDTRIDWVRLLFTDRTGADAITFDHYCDGTATTSGTDEQQEPTATTTAAGPVYTTDVNLGPCHYHSFKISSTTDETDGLELSGFGMVYESEDMISQ